MTADEVIAQLTAFPGVVAMTADEASGAPEIAWGDTFFYYEPDDLAVPLPPPDRRFPFATIVTKDYPDFDTRSGLDRPGVFRLNVSVGRNYFERLLGFPPAGFEEHVNDFDYADADRVVPHPIYGRQGWVSIVVPGERTRADLAALLDHAYQRVRARHSRRS